MRRLNAIIILPILLFVCNLEGKCATSRISFGYGVESPLVGVNQRWVEYVQKTCKKDLAEMKKELREYELYLTWNVAKADVESSAKRLRQGGPPSNQKEVLFGCLTKSYHLLYGFTEEDDIINHVKLSSYPHVVPRRYLADKSSKESSSSDPGQPADILDEPLIIPPELLNQPPPPGTIQISEIRPAKEERNTDLNKIIAIVALVAGILVIFVLFLFCCLLRGSSFGDKQRDDRPLLTLSSSDLSAGSSRNSDNKDFRLNSSFNNSSLNTNGNTLATIPEHNRAPRDAEALNSGKPHGKSGPSAPRPPAAPPPPLLRKPQPPPPPKGVRPPPAPPKVGGKGPHSRGRSASGEGSEVTGDPDAPRTKLKPFFWDKVVGNTDHSMVWDEIRAGSFQFNEEMIESLFGYNPDDKRNGGGKGRLSDTSQPQYIKIIDPKKSQNLAILLKALNITTEEVRDALIEGNELPVELLQTLLRMAPTQEEELKLRLFTGDRFQLGLAERFLKVLVDIPFAYKRMESLLFMMTLKEEVSSIKESFVTLEVACDELKKSRLFLKLLEAVLKTGNRMNDGTYRGGAQAFKLDTLLKLADVKGTDGKTTLLHFVVQEIVRTEGMKALRAAKENRSISSMKTEDFLEDPAFDPTEQYRSLGLQVVSSISSELENVKKAAVIDADGLTITVSKLGQSINKIKDFLNNEMENSQEDGGFYEALGSFVEHSEGEVTWLQEEEKRISELVRNTADYFHGNAGREEGLRLFIIVRDFLIMLDKICVQLRQSFSKKAKNPSKETLTKSTSQDQQSMRDMRQRLFPAIADRRVDDSSSDSDDD